MKKGVFSVSLHQFLSNTRFFSKANKNSDVLFFPGCSFIGSSPLLVKEVYRYLQKHFANISMATFCCNKPSKIMKLSKYSFYMGNLESQLKQLGVKKVIVCCPNCYNQLSSFDFLEVVSIYEILDENDDLQQAKKLENIIIHDPCPTHKNEKILKSVRNLIEKNCLNFYEFDCAGKNNCCGKANMLYVKDRKKGVEITRRVAEKALDKTIVTYCFSCVDSFQGINKECIHILNIIFGDFKDTKNTWLNRFKISNFLNKDD